MTPLSIISVVNPFFGQASLGDHILQALDSQRLPRVILFAGPQALGKNSAALWLAMYDLCEQRSSRPCGACPNCRAHASNVHPEAIVLDTEAEDDKQALSVDLIRNALHRFSTVSQVPSRWLVILEAQRLTEEAANMLLKFLEELPSAVHVVMTSSAIDELPLTLRSRATTYYWHLVPSQELQTVNHGRTHAAIVARSAGRPGWLPDQRQQALTETAEEQRIDEALQAFITGYANPPAGPAASQRARIHHQLSFEELVVRELLLVAHQSTHRLLWPRWRERFTTITDKLSRERIRQLSEHFLDRNSYSQNLQPRLLYADLHLV